MAKKMLGESLSLGKISLIDEEGLFISVMNDAASFLCNLHSLMLALSESPTVCTIQFIEQGGILSRYTQRAVLWLGNSFQRRETRIISILKKKKKAQSVPSFSMLLERLSGKNKHSSCSRSHTNKTRTAGHSIYSAEPLLCLLVRCKITHFSIFFF